MIGSADNLIIEGTIMNLNVINSNNNSLTNRKSSELKGYCVIIEGKASGAYLAPQLIDIGYQCIHVHSDPITPIDPSTFQRDLYVADFEYKQDIRQLALRLHQYKPKFVLAGTESAVLLADELSDYLGLPSNSSETTNYRMNKYESNIMLARKGLNYAKSAKITNKKDLIIWSEKNGKPKVVVKPINSGGTEDVFVCENEKQLSQSFQAIMGKKNCLGLINKEILVQEFLEGTEFIVNTTSFGKKHYVTDIWKSEKVSIGEHNFIYDRTILMESKGVIQNSLIKYNSDVLEALEFKFGHCHNEIMMTDRGPVLVEMNPRISGGSLPKLSK